MLKYETPTKRGETDANGWVCSVPTGEKVFTFTPPLSDREQEILDGLFGMILNIALMDDFRFNTTFK